MMRTNEVKDISSEDIQTAAGVIPEDVPVFMLNLLRFKEHADYGERSDVAACSGREAYFERYVPAFYKIAAAKNIDGIKLFWMGDVLAHLVAPSDERWDDIAIVEYPNFAAFRQLIESPEYKAEMDHHRQATLEDWRLIASIKAQLPG